MLLAWSDAAEVMVQTEDLQPDSDCTDQQLRAALSRIGDVQLYQQERLSTSVGAERDVANLWCFHYRSPAEAQAINLSYSTPRDADGTHYQASIKVERAFFVSWWLLTAVTMLLPALVAWDRLRQSWRARSGRCRKCGYDLAKNVSGICPECGSPIQDRAESTSTQESQRQNA